MRGYDAWLQAPYDGAPRDDERYDKFCFEFGFEPGSDAAEVAFEEYREEEDHAAYDDYVDRKLAEMKDEPVGWDD